MHDDYKTHVGEVIPEVNFTWFDDVKEQVVAVISNRGGVCIVCDLKGNRYSRLRGDLRSASMEELKPKVPVEVKKEEVKPPAPVFRSDLPVNNTPRPVAPAKTGKKKSKPDSKPQNLF